MQQLRFTLSHDVRKQTEECLATLRKSQKRSIPAIYATLHHETGQEAFGLGFDNLDTAEPQYLYENNGEMFYMLMKLEQASKFDGKHVSLVEGYLELSDPQSD